MPKACALCADVCAVDAGLVRRVGRCRTGADGRWWAGGKVEVAVVAACECRKASDLCASSGDAAHACVHDAHFWHADLFYLFYGH